MYTLTPRIDATISKAKAILSILKSAAGSSWGQDKEIMTNTYKSIYRSTLEYGNQIWSPIIEESNWANFRESNLKPQDVSRLQVNPNLTRKPKFPLSKITVRC